MSIKKVTILYVLAFLLQLSVINLFSIGGIAPNLIFCLTVFICFRFNLGYRCVPFALVASLLLDTCAGNYVGLSALALFLTCIFVIWVKYYMNTDLLKTLLATGAVATIVYGLLYWIMAAIMKFEYSLVYVLQHQIFYIVYNLIVMSILWLFYSNVYARWKLRGGAPDKEEDSI